VGAGILFGLGVALALTHMIRALLYGIGPTDLVTFTVVPITLAIVALLACYIPAHRAAKVHPMIALRYE
jgi:ABC-type lipoprotein release transport system permease subunit